MGRRDGVVGQVWHRPKTGSNSLMLSTIDGSGDLPPSQAIGGSPKKRGPQARIHGATPPPPANRIGGGGRISREIRKFLTLSVVIWRRGSNFSRKMLIFGSLMDSR